MPTPSEIVILQQQLQQAAAAYHNLMLGTQARVIVDQNGERAEFTPANAGRLMAYIQSLKLQLGLVSNPGPMRVWM